MRGKWLGGTEKAETWEIYIREFRRQTKPQREAVRQRGKEGAARGDKGGQWGPNLGTVHRPELAASLQPSDGCFLNSP